MTYTLRIPLGMGTPKAATRHTGFTARLDFRNVSSRVRVSPSHTPFSTTCFPTLLLIMGFELRTGVSVATPLLTLGVIGEF